MIIEGLVQRVLRSRDAGALPEASARKLRAMDAAAAAAKGAEAAAAGRAGERQQVLNELRRELGRRNETARTGAFDRYDSSVVIGRQGDALMATRTPAVGGSVGLVAEAAEAVAVAEAQLTEAVAEWNAATDLT